VLRVPYRPDVCGGGQPFCDVPRAYGLAEAKASCPCLDTPNASACQPPTDCVLPGCFVPDAEGARAACAGGRCVTRLADAGVPP
jgi:hypothetical protein